MEKYFEYKLNLGNLGEFETDADRSEYIRKLKSALADRFGNVDFKFEENQSGITQYHTLVDYEDLYDPYSDIQDFINNFSC